MFFCASADDDLYLYKILQNILNTYKVIKWIQLSKLQRGIILRYGSSSLHINYGALCLYHIL